MSYKKCEDGSEVSLWGVTKSIFKTVGYGLNAAAKVTEAAAIEAGILAEKAQNSASIFLVETLEITYLDGSSIEEPELTKLITNAYESNDDEFKEIIEIARVYNLDISKFLTTQRTQQELRRILDG